MAASPMGWGTPASEVHTVSFDDIVRAHRELEYQEQKAQENLNTLWAQFETQEGRVLTSFFGPGGHTGAALTHTREWRGPIRKYVSRPVLHTAVDLAEARDAAELVSCYERVSVKAQSLLSGGEREHVMRVVYDRLCRLISVIDRMNSQPIAPPDLPGNGDDPLAPVAAGESASAAATAVARRASIAAARRTQISAEKRRKDEEESRIDNALNVARGEAVSAEDICNRAIRRTALMSYFIGMVLGVFVFSAVGVGVGLALHSVTIAGFKLQSFLTVAIAGTVGAIVSVMTRMTDGDAGLEYETGRRYLRLLGMFRPLIGAIFAVALYFGIASGLIQFIKPPTDPNAVFFFYAFIGFLAGFSERWARDIISTSKATTSTARVRGGADGTNAEASVSVTRST